MPTSTLTSKGQITLPRAIRERLGVKQGDRVGAGRPDSCQGGVKAVRLQLTFRAFPDADSSPRQVVPR